MYTGPQHGSGYRPGAGDTLLPDRWAEPPAVAGGSGARQAPLWPEMGAKMGFRLLILGSGQQDDTLYMEEWPRLLREAIPDIQIDACPSVGDALEVIGEADAAFGNIVPELFERGRKLRWVNCPQAGPRAGYYHQALIDSDVVVTNMRAIYSDHISAHIMAFVLAFARGFHVYLPQQLRREWRRGYPTLHLPEATAVIVGVGGIGSETARLCSEFGITVLAVDPRAPQAPPGVAELHRSDALLDVLPRGDFVIVTVPETPQTQGMFTAREFAAMKPSAFLINIGRGATVVLDDLVAALESGTIGGAGMDVFEQEPLPPDHPLWTAPGVLITPHVAGTGPYLDDRRIELFIDNCLRFDKGVPLKNVVDKALWF